MNATTLITLGALGGFYLYSRRPAGPGVAPGAGTATIPPGAPTDVRRWRDFAVDAGRRYAVSPQLVLAVIWQESYGNPSARGSAGEIGLMQLKDVAAIDVGFRSAPWAPEANIFVGTAYLALQTDRMGNVYDGLRAYNQGEGGARAGKGFSYADEVVEKAGWV